MIDSKKHKATITICASASFYSQVIEVQEKLETMGYRVIVPLIARTMKESGDFDVSHYKTWYDNDEDYHKKTDLMRGHFDEVKKGDVCLVLNYKKHDTDNYIGGNVLMEMAIAFYLHKPIFILNKVPSQSAFLEEILGLNPITLNGKIEDLDFSLA
jgi:hypothetical protein